jgi:hypothetical protein
MAVTATATTAAGTHKRQISEAVPRDERPNRPKNHPRGAAATTGFGGLPRRARGVNIGAGIGAGAANNTRKSGRARKPNGVIEVQLQSNCSANGA